MDKQRTRPWAWPVKKEERTTKFCMHKAVTADDVYVTKRFRYLSLNLRYRYSRLNFYVKKSGALSLVAKLYT